MILPETEMIGMFELCRVSSRKPRSCLARPKERNYYLMCLEERNLCVEQKAPKPLTPAAWQPRIGRTRALGWQTNPRSLP